MTVFGIVLIILLCNCAAPQSVRIQRGPENQGGSSTAVESLTVLTFNIWGLPKWINGASEDRFVRIAAQLEEDRPDLILLQEVWTKAAHAALPRSGWWVATCGTRANYARRNGLASLSRFPVLHAEFRAFRNESWPDALVAKGALKLTVQLDRGHRLNVWNVHLQAGPDETVRLKQIAQLIDWVRCSENHQAADLIGGDFNCTPDSAAYAALVQALGPDVQRLEARTHFTTYDGRSSDSRRARTLDYVFIRLRQPGLTTDARCFPAMDHPNLEERLSDHLGVWVDLQFGHAGLAFSPN